LLEENSRVIPNGANIPIPNSTGIGVTQVPVDTVARQNFTGTVVAKDGLTIAVGGLIDEGVSDHRTEVPVLGRIPYIGMFFRRQDTRRFRNELIILIRPFVMTTPCEAGEASNALVSRLSIHPAGPDPSSLGAFTPMEVLRPNPPVTRLQQLLRVHTVLPKDY
jgi:general secretion pathway protein D